MRIDGELTIASSQNTSRGDVHFTHRYPNKQHDSFKASQNLNPGSAPELNRTGQSDLERKKKSFLQPLVEQGLSTRPGFLIFFRSRQKRKFYNLLSHESRWPDNRSSQPFNDPSVPSGSPSFLGSHANGRVASPGSGVNQRARRFRENSACGCVGGDVTPYIG